MARTTQTLQASGPGPVSRSRRRFLQATSAGFVVAALPAYGGDLAFENTIQWGREAIGDAMRANPDVAAVSIALFSGEALVWQEAFGLASVPDGIKATTQTRFNIGSVSKVLAGLTGVLLQERGLLALDKPVAAYLPGFSMLSPDYADITVRHLLCHASGLPGTNPRDIFSFAPLPGYAADTEQELANSHLKHAPGELAVYCNDGFTLFEQVVLAVTGSSYPDFVEKNILGPLEMTLSGYPREPLPAGSFAAAFAGGKDYGEEFVNAYATGGLCTTPGDMMKLAQMFLDGGAYQGGQLVSAKSIAAMATEQANLLRFPINPSPEWRWGLGWDNVRQFGLAMAGITAWEKNGGTAFFSSEFFVLPRQRIALLLTGNGGYNALSIAEGILMQALQDGGFIAAPPVQVGDAVPALATADPGTFQAAGIYGNFKAPLKVEVAMGGNLLALSEWDGQGWAPLNGRRMNYSYRSDGWWWSDDAGVPSYRFDAGQPGGYRYLIERLAIGQKYERVTLPLGQQLAPLAPLSDAWQARLGSRWRVTNESPESVAMALGDEPLVLGSLPELAGYVLVGGGQFGYELLIPLSDARAGMAVKVPVNHGRDLFEIVFQAGDGGEALLLASQIYARL